MSITFPSSPINGQTFLTKGRGWQYNSTSGSWEALVRVNTAFDSDDIQEGTNNLYLNTENIQDSVANLLTAGNNISINIPFTEISKDIVGHLSKFKNKDCWVMLQHRRSN